MALRAPGQLRGVDATEADTAQYVVIDCGTIELGEKALQRDVGDLVALGHAPELGLGVG